MPIHLVIGADPGVSQKQGGALVGLCRDLSVAGVVAADRAPLGWWRKAKRDGSDPDSWLHPALRLRLALLSIIGDVNPARVLVLVERQHIRAGEGGGGKQIRDQGLLEGVAAGLGCQVKTIEPRAWRTATATAAGSNRAKGFVMAADFLRAQIPELELTPGRLRKPHTGILSAGCIAWTGWRMWGDE